MEPTATPQPATTRYDSADNRRGNLSAKLIVIGAILAAIVAAVVLWQYFSMRLSQTVDASPAGFERTADNSLSFSLDVTRKNPEEAAYCIVTALNYGKEEVGRRDVYVPAGGPSTQRLTVDIPTRDVAVAGTVYGCSASVPHYLEAK